MLYHSLPSIVALAASISCVLAVTSLSDATMTQYLNEGGLRLAMSNAPVWFFGQAQNQPPCIPTWSYSGSPTTPDIYDTAHRTSPAPRCNFPNVGCNCRKPGIGIGNPTPDFPIYYSYRKCNDNEVRAALNLFYEKDGFIAGFDFGHDWDWERVIIVYAKDTSGNWSPSQLIMGQHSGYQKKNWADIQNTLTTDQAASSDPRQNQAIRNQDHPKVYVAWAKHPHYDTRNTGFNDPVSQSTDKAFRSQDWWKFVPSKYYIRADDSTTAGQVMRSQDWGSADSIPPVVNSGICSVNP